MGNAFSVNIAEQTTNNEINDEIKGKVLTQDDNSRNLINIKKSNNYEEMECIDNYCNNYYVNGQKNIEKECINEVKDYKNDEVNKNENSINPDSLKSEKVNDYINIIKIDSSNSDNNLHVSNNCNQIGRSASGVNQDNYLSLCRQSSNYSSTIVNDNSKYSSATTVNRNNSINCHNSSYVEEILKDHHEDMNTNYINDVLSSGFISHEDLLDNFDNGTSSINPNNYTSISYDSNVNKELKNFSKNNNELNNNKDTDNNLLLNQISENNDVYLDIKNDDESSCGSSKDYSYNYDDEYVNMGNYFFNNKDIIQDNNIIDYEYNPTYYDIWSVKEDNNILNDNYSNDRYNDNNAENYNYNSSYKSSYSDTYQIKNKYKGFQEFKSTANSSSYFLNKTEKTKTDSQIMLFPEIAKQINKEKIKVYNSKPFSISSQNSTDDCSSILNYVPSKQTLYPKDAGYTNENSMSTSKLNSKVFNDSAIFSDNNSTSVLQITRSNSVIVTNENDFNGNKKITNLIRESQYNLRNLKNLKLNDKPKDNKMAVRYNSCSTLLIDNTITTADMDDTIRCVTLAILYRIRANHKKNVKLVTNKIFSEKLYPLTMHPRFSPNPPTEKEIYKFLKSLFHSAELNSECAIITLIYVERMLAYTNITIHSCNWTRILLGGVLLASKVWDDHAIWNADFCQIFPIAAVEDMNKLERWYMNAINYNVSIRSSLFVKYYFELRELVSKKGKHLKLKPLNSNDAKLLEEKINQSDDQRNNLSILHYNLPDKKGIRRTVSDSNFKSIAIQASLF